MLYETNRFNKAFSKAIHINLNDYYGIVIMSDCHRGCGTWTDNFLPNKPIYMAALKYYYQNSYAYVELGDGDELWENRNYFEIKKTHNEIFSLFDLLSKENRLFIIHGNHDIKLKKTGRYEAMIIHTNTVPLYLLHGHQGDLINDSLWPLSRWLVRYVWKPLELRGVRNPTSAAKNNTKLKKTEERYVRYSCNNNCILITGHTHRPMIRKDEKCGIYINSGSCIHPNAITCIEIKAHSVHLVKWSLCARDDMSVYICKEILASLDIKNPQA